MADETVTVTSHTEQDIVVEQVDAVEITIEATGPPGPEGVGLGDHLEEADPHPQYLTEPEGDARYLLQGDITEDYVQSTPATTWTIPHSLPYKPNVSVAVDLGNGLEEVTTDVSWPDATTVVIHMATPRTGEAYLT